MKDDNSIFKKIILNKILNEIRDGIRHDPQMILDWIRNDKNILKKIIDTVYESKSEDRDWQRYASNKLQFDRDIMFHAAEVRNKDGKGKSNEKAFYRVGNQVF